MPKTAKPELHPKTAQDIHNYDQRILSCLRRIEKALSGENVSLIQKYHRAMKLETIAKATQLKHLEVMLNLSRFLKKDWKEATLDDIQNLTIHFMEIYSQSGQETNTTADHKKVLKIFFRWLKTGQRKKDPNSLDPIEIRNIRHRRVKDRLSREDLISEEDLTKLIHACGENSRDKALIAVHFESGSRIGETLSLQLKHISLDEHGAKIKVDG
ncbi:MAG TPA: integrase, partial [Nitrosopumilaceae archaeon]|nr:integrase [Nitrosopumilaceae archaeon]